MTAPAPTRLLTWPKQLGRLRLLAANALVAAFLLVMAIEAIPQTPLAWRLSVQRWIVPLGIAQGPWTLFAPGPDRTNMRLRVEITYRDGVRREWTLPNWREQSALAMWAGHRRREWLTRLITQEGQPAWKHWCRRVARELRPELTDAERGATIRIIYREGVIAPAEQKPWRSMREPPEFQGEVVLLRETVR